MVIRKFTKAQKTGELPQFKREKRPAAQPAES